MGSLYIVLEGALDAGGRLLGPGESYGGSFLLRQSANAAGVVVQGTRLFRLSLQSFDDLCERHPRLGLKLYRNLAESQCQ